MNLTELAAVAEIISSAAIVATLVYLAMQPVRTLTHYFPQRGNRF